MANKTLGRGRYIQPWIGYIQPINQLCLTNQHCLLSQSVLQLNSIFPKDNNNKGVIDDEDDDNDFEKVMWEIFAGSTIASSAQ